MANLNLRAEEYLVLEDYYSVPGENDKVFYKNLVEEVETVFTLKGLEKDPLLRPQEFKTPEFLDPEKRLNAEENDFLNQTMRKLALLVRKYRVMPKDFFKDADKVENRREFKIKEKNNNIRNYIYCSNNCGNKLYERFSKWNNSNVK